MIKHVKGTKDSFQFLSRFSIDDANVALSLPRDSDSWFSSILCVFEQDFIVGRNGGDDVDKWSDVVIIRGRGHLANIFHWLLFFQNVMAYITEKLLLTLELALDIALIHFYFSLCGTINWYSVAFSILKRIVCFTCINTTFLSYV